jgi:hypothetical protein
VKPEKAQGAIEASVLAAYETEVEKYEDEFDLWMERQATIKSAILASIPERYQTRLVSLATAKEMWDELSRNFEKQSDLVKSDLFSTLVTLRTPEGGSVLDTIDKLLHSYNDYCAAGGVLEMNQLASILINAIPKEYHSTITAFCVNNGTPDPRCESFQRSLNFFCRARPPSCSSYFHSSLSLPPSSQRIINTPNLPIYIRIVMARSEEHESDEDTQVEEHEPAPWRGMSRGLFFLHILPC